MKYKVDDIVKATVTKSKPGQDVGLALEERSSHIYITNVAGLFQRSGVPVHAEDQLLEVNGISVLNQAVFPNGVEDIEKFLKGEWNIWLKVKKGSDAEDSWEGVEPLAGYKDSELSYPSIHPRQKKFSSPTLFSRNESYDSEDSTISHSDEDNATEGQPRARSASSITGAEKRRGNRRSQCKGTKSTEDGEAGSVSENTDATCALSEDDNTQPRTEARMANLLSIEENETNASLSPLTPSKPNINTNGTNKQPSDKPIKSIKSNSGVITVEMNDGQSICVTTDQLLRVVSNSGIDAPDMYPPKKKKSKGKLKDKSRSLTEQNHSSTKDVRKKSKKAPRRKSTGYLRNSDHEEGSISETRSVNRQDLRAHLTRVPKRKSLGSHSRNSDQSDHEPQFRSKSSDTNLDSSTHSCMTNLIDPGDLMKIRGFMAKPEMNGMTVEVVRKSKGTKGKRWDVRVITKKEDIKVKSSFNPKRLISVSAENLNHFV